MKNKIISIRGMQDHLPEQTILWQYIENEFEKLVSSYGYQKICFPIVENTSLF